MKRIVTLLLLGLCLAMAPPGDAQILGKLNKGLNKLNNTLEKVDKYKKDKKAKKPKGGENTAASSGSAQSAATQVDDSKWKKVSDTGKYPFITSQTKFMRIGDIYGESFSDVHEDIFWVVKENRYEFWTIDGRKLFGNDWENIRYGGETPKFNGGVAVARRAKANTSGKKPICLLYRDGSVRELDASYEDVTQFCDGLALVKKKVNYKDTYFYINARGEKVFPFLTVYWESVYDNKSAVRPLNNGLRAYAAGYHKWGYIDAKGNVVLPAKYCMARDFHEGSAWVGEGAQPSLAGNVKYHLIDTKGNIVYTTEKPSSESMLSDVSDGIFYIEKGSDIYYYDLKGNEIGHFEAGNKFYNGYAFVVPKEQREFTDITTALINKQCQIVKRISDAVVAAYIPEENGPKFEPYGLATVFCDDRSLILDPMGNVVVKRYYNPDTNTKINGFKQLTSCGYARVTDMMVNGVGYRGIMRADGMMEWLFSENEMENAEKYLPIQPFPLPEPEPGDDPEPEPEPGNPRPPVIKIINVNQPPIGPTKVIEKTYKVTLVTKGNGTASLSSPGPFKYGDMVSVNTVPQKDWAVGNIDIQGDGAAYLDASKPMGVTSDLTITVIFVKKPDLTKPEIVGTYQGLKDYYFNREESTPIDVYAEISENPDIESPYGKNTYGFMVLMIDPTVRRMGNGASAYIFGMPLKISGYQHEASGDEWLVCDGGSVSYHDMKMGSGNPLASLFYKLMMTFDGTENFQGVPRRYRIHIDKRDKNTGEITLGRLEVFSVKAGGWVPGGHKSVENVKKGMFMDVIEKGWPADTYQGVVLKPAQKRDDVYWYAPESWYTNPSLYKAIIESMRNSYGSFKTDIEKLFE